VGILLLKRILFTKQPSLTCLIRHTKRRGLRVAPDQRVPLDEEDIKLDADDQAADDQTTGRL